MVELFYNTKSITDKVKTQEKASQEVSKALAEIKEPKKRAKKIKEVKDEMVGD